MLLLLLRFAFVWVGIYLGLPVRNPEAVVAVQVLVWPIGFLSNAIAPTATMPGWLGAVALAVAWPLLILAVFLPLAVRRWRRLSR